MTALPASAGIDRRRLLAGASAAAGLALAGGLVARRPADGPSELVRLVAPALRFVHPDAAPGRLPALGAPAVASGRLVDEAGAPAGRLDGTIVPSTGGDTALHTVALDDGTLLALGPRDHSGPFAIVGGSGRFAGASGTYVIEPVADRPGAHVLVIDLRRER